VEDGCSLGGNEHGDRVGRGLVPGLAAVPFAAQPSASCGAAGDGDVLSGGAALATSVATSVAVVTPCGSRGALAPLPDLWWAGRSSPWGVQPARMSGAVRMAVTPSCVVRVGLLGLAVSVVAAPAAELQQHTARDQKKLWPEADSPGNGRTGVCERAGRGVAIGRCGGDVPGACFRCGFRAGWSRPRVRRPGRVRRAPWSPPRFSRRRTAVVSEGMPWSARKRATSPPAALAGQRWCRGARNRPANRANDARTVPPAPFTPGEGQRRRGSQPPLPCARWLPLFRNSDPEGRAGQLKLGSLAPPRRRGRVFPPTHESTSAR